MLSKADMSSSGVSCPHMLPRPDARPKAGLLYIYIYIYIYIYVCVFVCVFSFLSLCSATCGSEPFHYSF